jgi:cysteine desulfurase
MIYLDNQASTQCDPRVRDAMWPWLGRPANPHSAEHAAGREAAWAVEDARAQIAALIGAEPREIVFTSGATEANNLAIKGAARHAGRAERPRVITTATEHKCVLESVRDLAAEGFDPVILPVSRTGALAPDRLAEALRTPTLLLSVMLANNETGFIQDVALLADVARQAGARVHSDLAQAAGKIAVDVDSLGLDLASISAHKMYGPQGIGALYVRRRPRMRLAPLFSGGGQERGFRSGTLPVALAVGFGEAARIARAELQQDAAHTLALRTRMLEGLRARIPSLEVNGPLENRLPGNLSVRFPGAQALALIEACPALAVSTGSACTSAEVAPSHVLTAISLTAEQAAATLRLGIGRFNSPADIDNAVHMLAGAYASLAHAPQPAAEA